VARRKARAVACQKQTTREATCGNERHKHTATTRSASHLAEERSGGEGEVSSGNA